VARVAGTLPALQTFIGDRPMHALLQELRLAIRTLGGQPGITVAIVLTLAIGIGANAAIFRMFDALLLRPFSFPGLDRLAMLSEVNAEEPYPQEAVSPANFTDFETQLTSLDRLAAFKWADVNLSGGDQPERVSAFAVSAHFFDLLGVTPAHGRLLLAGDNVWGRHRQLVLSDGLWKRRFGGDPAMVGRTVHLDGQAFVVVGIAPAGFDFPNAAELWIPLALEPEDAAERTLKYLTVFGRLAPGRTMADARAEATTVYARLQVQHPTANRTRRLEVRSFTSGMVDYGLPTVLALWQAAALLVLLIGCTNVVNLLLARAAERRRELAVRTALGASRARVVRQLILESVVLSAVAVPSALGVAWLGLRLMKAAMPPSLLRFVPGWDRLGISWELMALTAAAACLVGALFGLLPALAATRADVVDVLKDGGRSQTAGATRSRLRRGLVVAELALALPLLVASGLAATGVQQFATGPQGYDPQGLLRLSLVLPDTSYPSDDSKRRFNERLLAEVSSLAGVRAAATASVLPASPSNSRRIIEVEGRTVDPARRDTVNYRAVSPSLLETMRMPIVEGRGIAPQDRDGVQRVAVVSRSMAARFWPDRRAVGARLRVPSVSQDWITVVGVSGDVIHGWFDNRNEATIYLPVAQAPSSQVNLVIRTDGDPASLAPHVLRALAAVDPQQPAFRVMTMREALQERTVGLRFIGGLMAVFGGVALLLAAIGIYSVMSFYVTRRRHEMGLRMALGASPRDVLRLTLSHAGRLTLTGLAIGIGLAVALARVMQQALFGIVSADPLLVGGIAVALGATALLASLVPARAAMRVDPTTALRE
jgi:putative ABC transport system permease protein